MKRRRKSSDIFYGWVYVSLLVILAAFSLLIARNQEFTGPRRNIYSYGFPAPSIKLSEKAKPLDFSSTKNLVIDKYMDVFNKKPFIKDDSSMVGVLPLAVLTNILCSFILAFTATLLIRKMARTHANTRN